MIQQFSILSLPQLSSVARRTALGSLIIGAVALVGLALAGYPLVGLGACVGLGLALGNFRMISSAVGKVSKSDRESKRRPLAMNTLARLGVLSVIAVALLLLVPQLGFGALIGLAVFQFVLLANVTVSMIKAGHTPGEAL
ncbi:MAG: ATP synthase subunit I [Acidimicrobiales bacterium]